MENIKVFNGHCHGKPQAGDYLVSQEDFNWIIKSILELLEGQCNNVPPYRLLKDICPHLYEIQYDTIDYDFAYEYFKNGDTISSPGYCSSVRNGDFYGRNLDWRYEDNADFVVKTPKYNGRHAVMGVAGNIKGLTDLFVTSRLKSELYKIVPFYLLDGANDYGVFANINVVPSTGIPYTTPTENKLLELSSSMVVRYILDNFDSADEAIEFIIKHVQINFALHVLEEGFAVHYLIGDQRNTYVLEFLPVNGKLIGNCIVNNRMTNFYLKTLLEPTTTEEIGNMWDGSVRNSFFLQRDLIDVINLSEGIERWNIISHLYDQANTKEGMRELLNNILYSNTYTNIDTDGDISKCWYSEFLGDGLTILNVILNADLEKVKNLLNLVKGYWDRRDHPYITDLPVWLTTHSCVYDFNEKMLYIKVLEGRDTADHKEYIFDFDISINDIKHWIEDLQNGLKLLEAKLQNLIDNTVNRPLKFTAVLSSTIELSNLSDKNVEYSYDSNKWHSWDGDLLELNEGDCVYIRGNNPYGFTTTNKSVSQFTLTGKLNCEGNVMSLLGEYTKEIPCDLCFLNLFDCVDKNLVNQYALLTAPELPAEKMTVSCYENMFRYCRAITLCPKLPATELADNCYLRMFFYCDSLKSLPELPALTLKPSCYRRMFYNCFYLDSCPEITVNLPAKVLADLCYGLMFTGDSKVTTINLNAENILSSAFIENGNAGVFFGGGATKIVISEKAVDSINGIPNVPSNCAVECPNALYYITNSLGIAFNGSTPIKCYDILAFLTIDSNTGNPVQLGSLFETPNNKYKYYKRYSNGKLYMISKYNNSIFKGVTGADSEFAYKDKYGEGYIVLGSGVITGYLYSNGTFGKFTVGSGGTIESICTNYTRYKDSRTAGANCNFILRHANATI